MGMESYFLNVKLAENAPRSFAEICAQLAADGFQVTAEKQRWFAGKKPVSDQVIVEKVVVLDYNEKKQTVSMEACFSCFEKSRNCMAAIARYFSSRAWAENAFYGTKILPDAAFSTLEAWIDEYTAEKRRIFIQNYGDQQIDLLPNADFYRKYRKFYR